MGSTFWLEPTEFFTDEYEVDVEEDNVVNGDNDVVDDVKEDEVHVTSQMIPPPMDMKPPTNDDVLQYKNCKLQLKEKTFWLLGMNPCCVVE